MGGVNHLQCADWDGWCRADLRFVRVVDEGSRVFAECSPSEGRSKFLLESALDPVICFICAVDGRWSMDICARASVTSFGSSGTGARSKIRNTQTA